MLSGLIKARNGIANIKSIDDDGGDCEDDQVASNNNNIGINKHQRQASLGAFVSSSVNDNKYLSQSKMPSTETASQSPSKQATAGNAIAPLRRPMQLLSLSCSQHNAHDGSTSNDIKRRSNQQTARKLSSSHKPLDNDAGAAVGSFSDLTQCYEEIDQIYDYVRGLAPLPVQLRRIKSIDFEQLEGRKQDNWIDKVVAQQKLAARSSHVSNNKSADNKVPTRSRESKEEAGTASSGNNKQLINVIQQALKPERATCWRQSIAPPAAKSPPTQRRSRQAQRRPTGSIYDNDGHGDNDATTTTAKTETGCDNSGSTKQVTGITKQNAKILRVTATRAEHRPAQVKRVESFNLNLSTNTISVPNKAAKHGQVTPAPGYRLSPRSKFLTGSPDETPFRLPRAQSLSVSLAAANQGNSSIDSTSRQLVKSHRFVKRTGIPGAIDNDLGNNVNGDDDDDDETTDTSMSSATSDSKAKKNSSALPDRRDADKRLPGRNKRQTSSESDSTSGGESRPLSTTIDSASSSEESDSNDSGDSSDPITSPSSSSASVSAPPGRPVNNKVPPQLPARNSSSRAATLSSSKNATKATEEHIYEQISQQQYHHQHQHKPIQQEVQVQSASPSLTPAPLSLTTRHSAKDDNNKQQQKIKLFPPISAAKTLNSQPTTKLMSAKQMLSQLTSYSPQAAQFATGSLRPLPHSSGSRAGVIHSLNHPTTTHSLKRTSAVLPSTTTYNDTHAYLFGSTPHHTGSGRQHQLDHRYRLSMGNLHRSINQYDPYLFDQSLTMFPTRRQQQPHPKYHYPFATMSYGRTMAAAGATGPYWRTPVELSAVQMTPVLGGGPGLMSLSRRALSSGRLASASANPTGTGDRPATGSRADRAPRLSPTQLIAQIQVPRAMPHRRQSQPHSVASLTSSVSSSRPQPNKRDKQPIAISNNNLKLKEHNIVVASSQQQQQQPQQQQQQEQQKHERKQKKDKQRNSPRRLTALGIEQVLDFVRKVSQTSPSSHSNNRQVRGTPERAKTSATGVVEAPFEPTQMLSAPLIDDEEDDDGANEDGSKSKNKGKNDLVRSTSNKQQHRSEKMSKRKLNSIGDLNSSPSATTTTTNSITDEADDDGAEQVQSDSNDSKERQQRSYYRTGKTSDKTKKESDADASKQFIKSEGPILVRDGRLLIGRAKRPADAGDIKGGSFEHPVVHVARVPAIGHKQHQGSSKICRRDKILHDFEDDSASSYEAAIKNSSIRSHNKTAAKQRQSTSNERGNNSSSGEQQISKRSSARDQDYRHHQLQAGSGTGTGTGTVSHPSQSISSSSSNNNNNKSSSSLVLRVPKLSKRSHLLSRPLPRLPVHLSSQYHHQPSSQSHSHNNLKQQAVHGSSKAATAGNATTTLTRRGHNLQQPVDGSQALSSVKRSAAGTNQTATTRLQSANKLSMPLSSLSRRLIIGPSQTSTGVGMSRSQAAATSPVGLQPVEQRSSSKPSELVSTNLDFGAVANPTSSSDGDASSDGDDLDEDDGDEVDGDESEDGEIENVLRATSSAKSSESAKSKLIKQTDNDEDTGKLWRSSVDRKSSSGGSRKSSASKQSHSSGVTSCGGSSGVVCGSTNGSSSSNRCRRRQERQEQQQTDSKQPAKQQQTMSHLSPTVTTYTSSGISSRLTGGGLTRREKSQSSSTGRITRSSTNSSSAGELSGQKMSSCCDDDDIEAIDDECITDDDAAADDAHDEDLDDDRVAGEQVSSSARQNNGTIGRQAHADRCTRVRQQVPLSASSSLLPPPPPTASSQQVPLVTTLSHFPNRSNNQDTNSRHADSNELGNLRLFDEKFSGKFFDQQLASSNDSLLESINFSGGSTGGTCLPNKRQAQLIAVAARGSRQSSTDHDSRGGNNDNVHQLVKT